MKQIVFWVLIFSGCLSVAVLIGWYFGLPNAIGMFAISAGIGTIAIGYYAWKAKAENIVKIKQNGILTKEEMSLIIQMKEECGNKFIENLSKVISTPEIGG